MTLPITLPNNRTINQITSKKSAYSNLEGGLCDKNNSSLLTKIKEIEGKQVKKIIMYSDLTQPNLSSASFRLDNIETFQKKTIKVHVLLKAEPQQLTITRNGQAHIFNIHSDDAKEVLLEILLDDQRGIALKTEHLKKISSDQNQKLLIDKPKLIEKLINMNPKWKQIGKYLFLE